MKSRILAIVFLLALASPSFAQQGDGGRAAGGLALCTFTSAVLVLIVILFFDLLPIVVCIYRGHPDTAAISIITILLGWTCIGWIFALIWAVKAFDAKDDDSDDDYEEPRRRRRRRRR